MASNTYVSQPGDQQQWTMPMAPGAAGPGGQMNMAHAVVWLIVGAAGISVATGYLARKGIRPELGRFDAIDAVWNAATVAVVFGTFKILAYRFHGHKLSQAVLLVL
jgi:hypothetical protein